MPTTSLVHTLPHSILIVLPTWVGDFVMATPFLRAVRKRFAEARITFLLEPNLRDLVQGGDWMDECFEWPDKEHRRPWSGEYRELLQSLRRTRFDWAILLPNSFRAALVARLSGAGRRIGYDRDGRGWLLTDRVHVSNRRRKNGKGARTHGRTKFETSRRQGVGTPNPIEHRPCSIPDRSGGRFMPTPLVEYYADLAEAIGCQRPGDELELFPTSDCEGSVDQRLHSLGIARHHPLVVISPGAKYGAAKCWPPDRFAAAADQLVEREGAAIIVTCGPGEEPIAAAIARAMTQRGFVLDDPRLTLGELKSLVRRSDLLLCNDAGPRHFAKAFGVPVVTIFGPTHPAWTATQYPLERIVRIDVDCGPCQRRLCPLGHLKCMTGVTVEMVLAAASQVLRSRRTHPSQLGSDGMEKAKGRDEAWKLPHGPSA